MSSKISSSSKDKKLLIRIKELLKKYFFQYAETFDDLFNDTNSIFILSYTEKEKIYYKFKKVENVTEMIKLLKSIPGIYSQLCQKILSKEMFLKITGPQEIHHIFPLHLSSNGIFEFSKLDRPLNMIEVHPIIHFILHYFWFLEFGEFNDYRIFPLLSPFMPKAKDTLIFSPLERILYIFENWDIIIENLKDGWNNCPISSYVLEIINSETRWQYKNFYTEKNPLILKPVDSLPDLWNKLLSSIPKEEQEKKKNYQNTPRNPKYDVQILTKYLNGDRKYAPLSFILINQPEKMKTAQKNFQKSPQEIIEFTKKQQKNAWNRTFDPILEEIFANTMIWKKKYQEKTTTFSIEPGKIQSTIDLVFIFRKNDPEKLWEAAMADYNKAHDMSTLIGLYLRVKRGMASNKIYGWTLITPCDEFIKRQREYFSKWK